ncbi:MAG: PD-(D/E)XK nuclease family protein [Saprospiraceae bacterium]
MKLLFGLHLDDLTVPQIKTNSGGIVHCGPTSLLNILETHLGLSGFPENIEFLRVEQYRQALIQHAGGKQLAVGSQQSLFGEVGGNENAASEAKSYFYHKSFAADPFATAAELLSRRDELLLGGWDFSIVENLPPRLKTLSEVEAIFHQEPAIDKELIVLTPGFADRFCLVLEKLAKQGHPFESVILNEPLELLPYHFQRLFQLIGETGNQPTIEQLPKKEKLEQAKTDLERFQNLLNGDGNAAKQALAADGSLILVRAKRSNEAASFVAQLLRLNPGFQPACLIPDKSRTLEMALVKEGLPSLGILSASLARPALQILKLAPTFLWKPIDPFKILEFASLAIKPLPEELATQIANEVARAPGLQGDGWYAMTNRYFSELENTETPAVVAEQRKQFDFWFDRPRFSLDQSVPKSEVVEIFDYLRDWALKTFEENGSKNQSLVVLSEQAKRIVELLQALPERELGYLQLERIVRTIYEPSPVTFQEREVGSMDYAMHPSAFIGEVKEVIWWDFIQKDPPHFFSRWYPHERAFLEKLNILLDTPQLQNARMLWQRTRPVLMAKDRLVLVLPDVVDGVMTLSHPLLGNLEAAFNDLEKTIVDISHRQTSLLAEHFVLPVWKLVERRSLGQPKPFLQVKNIEIGSREKETLTSLESLFYYPYQWFFRYKIKLQQSAILSIVKDNTLMGNLAHRVFEKLLGMDEIYSFERSTLNEWVEQFCRRLLQREGAVLLMYGREPERIAFVNKLKFAAWSLVSHIRENGWKVLATEKELAGRFPVVSDKAKVGNQVDVKGIADLVLKRGDELAVIDLKWRGAAYRANVLKNEEDLQLVLYSRMVAEEGPWAHTSYFIIENGKMVARNNLAFKGITPLAPEADYAAVNEKILSAMEATWHWRMAQLAKGEIEIRTRQTLMDIEEKYADEGQGQLLLEILEMKGEDAKWDDYRTLINLVQ